MHDLTGLVVKSLRLHNCIGRRRRGWECSSHAQVAEVAVVADIGRTEAFRWSETVLRSWGQLTNAMVENPHTVEPDSYCYDTLPCPARRSASFGFGLGTDETLRKRREVETRRFASPETETVFSVQHSDLRLGRRTNSSGTEGKDWRCNLKMSPETRF